jgi:hypothetical protein
MKVLLYNIENRSMIEDRSKPYKYIGKIIDNKKFGFGIKLWDNNAYLKGFFNDNTLNGFTYFKTSTEKIFMGNHF